TMPVPAAAARSSSSATANCPDHCRQKHGLRPGFLFVPQLFAMAKPTRPIKTPIVPIMERVFSQSQGTLQCP
ncbi:MAG: hypothetical protein RSC66_14295, partial [Comamonas sp.]